jgi:hypothetical protein
VTALSARLKDFELMIGAAARRLRHVAV